MLGASWMVPPAVQASTVRLADVESPELREGLRAATSGEFAKAELIFARLLNEDPTSASVWSNLGNVHMSQGRAKQAYDDYSQAVQLAPEAPVPYLNRAIALEQLGLQLAAEGRPAEAGERWQEALADCDSAIARDGKEFAAWFNKVGQVDTAVRTVKGVLRRNPNYAEAHTSLAAMLWSQGQLAAAEGQLEAALELGGRWRDPDWVALNTRWPPALVAALQRLVEIGDAQPGQRAV
ncbi:hypothetical protein GPECTOR_167g170 [Gonium pectorale]|uniref:Uncharacterized protein n=1 Tax=Gonium pectorale TaxID=33097 RepID=A0A150FXG0_GONPE|nr:hypothetical protein GPECTOR_167g170 [Gonium pectorale]|eukprot:KXZ42289.1 hypothetical protein GPECTOR_167g170 [Gonium pectorale]